MDSTAVALAAATVGVKLQCVTLDMGGGRSADAAAARIAEQCGFGYECVSVDSTEDDAEAYFAAMDRRRSMASTPSSRARPSPGQGLKVALSGAGGDEVLGAGTATTDSRG